MAAVLSGFRQWFASVDDGSGSGGKKRITLSKHCVERYRERFRPGLDVDPAREELSRVIANGVLVDAPPDWVALESLNSHTSYLVVGGDLVLALIDRRDALLATTCLGRGAIRPSERRRRRKGKVAGRRHGSAEGRRKERRPVPYCRTGKLRFDEDLSIRS